MDEVLRNVGAYPVHGVGCEARAALGIELGKRFHQAEISFGDQLIQGRAISAPVTTRDCNHVSTRRSIDRRTFERVS